jgi:hypothetical protein
MQTRDAIVAAAISLKEGETWAVSLAEIERVFPPRVRRHLSAVDYFDSVLLSKGCRAEMGSGHTVIVRREVSKAKVPHRRYRVMREADFDSRVLASFDQIEQAITYVTGLSRDGDHVIRDDNDRIAWPPHRVPRD